MVAGRTRELLVPLTILASVAVGAVIGMTFGRSMSRTTPDSSTGSVDTKAFADAGDGLRTELVRLREKLEPGTLSAPTQEHADSRSVAGTPDLAADLRKTTAQLVQAADSLRNAANRAGGDRVPLVAPAAVDPSAFEVLWRSPPETIRKTHQLWTYQQVMDKYGAPDSVGTEQTGLYWMYQQGQKTVLFHFVDGRVAAVSP
jgi:hypothetical protein